MAPTNRKLTFIALLCVAVLWTSPTWAKKRHCDEVLAGLSSFALEHDTDRSATNAAFWFDYKSQPKVPPEIVDLGDPCGFNQCAQVSRTEIARHNRVRGTNYDRLVMQLKKGDTVVFGEKRFVLGEFLGAGNATHIFRLSEFPGRVIRIPFISGTLDFDERLNRLAVARNLMDVYILEYILKIKGQGFPGFYRGVSW